MESGWLSFKEKNFYFVEMLQLADGVPYVSSSFSFGDVRDGTRPGQSSPSSPLFPLFLAEGRPHPLPQSRRGTAVPIPLP